MQNFLLQVPKLIRLSWGKIVLAVILALVVVTNVRPGQLLIGNDNYSPELNPSVTLERSFLSPSWREYRVAGVASDTEQADIFRAGAFTALNPILPSWVLSQGYKFLALVAGVWFMALFTKLLASRYLGVSSETVFLLGGVLYLFSLQTLGTFYFMTVLFVAAYGFFPPVLYYSSRLIGSFRWSYYIGLIISLIFATTAALTVTVYLVFMVLWGVVMLSLIFLERGRLRYFLKLMLLLVTTIAAINLYWLLPLGYYLTANVQDVEDSYINRQLTPNFIENETDYNNLYNSLTFRFSWADTQLVQDEFTFTARDHYHDPGVTIALLMPTALALIGAAYCLVKRKWGLALLVLLYLSGLIMIMGDNSPFAGILGSLQEAVPLSKQVLRWPSSKLWMFMQIPIVVFGSVGGLIVLKGLDGIRKIRIFTWRYIVLPVTVVLSMLTILGSLILIGLPILRGNLFYERYFIDLPVAYAELENYLSKDPTGRVLILPEANTLYFHNHNWAREGQEFSTDNGPGFWGSGFLHYLIPNPIIDKSLTVGSSSAEYMISDILDSLYSEDLESFTKSLEYADVNYILMDKSHHSGLPGYDYNWGIYEEQIGANPALDLIWEHDFLQLYSWKNTPSTQVQDSLYPEVFSGLNWEVKNNYLVGTGEVEVTSIYDWQEVDARRLPTTVVLDGDQLSISPAVPSIVGEGYSTPEVSKLSILLPEGAKYLQIGNQYADLHSDSSATFEADVYSASETSYLFSKQSKQYDLLPTFNQKQITECEDNTQRALALVNQDKVVLRAVESENCLATHLDLGSEAVVHYNLTLNSTSAIQVRVCLWSDLEQRCLNRNTTVIVDGLTELSLQTDSVVKDSFIVLNLSWQNLEFNGELSILSAKAEVYDDRSKLGFDYPVDDWLLGQEMPISKGDAIEVSIPIVKSDHNYSWQAGGDLLPEFDARPCFRGDTANLYSTGNNWGISTSNCIFSIYPRLEVGNYSQGILFVYALNEAGIPLDYGVVDSNDDTERVLRYTVQNRTAYLAQNSQLDIFRLPTSLDSAYLSISSLGFRERPSMNQLKSIVYMGWPTEWGKFVMVATDDHAVVADRVSDHLAVYSTELDEQSKVLINQANAGGWVAVDVDSLQLSGEPVVENGWQQGFLMQPGRYIIFFWPNFLGYVGYAVLAIFLIMVVVAFVRSRRTENSINVES